MPYAYMLVTYKSMASKRNTKVKTESEKDFLARYDATAFDRPSVAVDVILLSAMEGELYTLVVRRTDHPAKGRWALPGTFVAMNESLEAAAARALSEKVGLEGTFIEQLYTFGEPKRDPRTRVISVAYYALVDGRRFEAACAETDRAQIGRVVVPWEGETGGEVELRGMDGVEMALAFDAHRVSAPPREVHVARAPARARDRARTPG
jgi:8-oxo-dGTP diphosphatase